MGICLLSSCTHGLPVEPVPLSPAKHSGGMRRDVASPQRDDSTAESNSPIPSPATSDTLESKSSIPSPVYGCMATMALNYNPSATVDDGSCEYPPLPTTHAHQHSDDVRPVSSAPSAVTQAPGADSVGCLGCPSEDSTVESHSPIPSPVHGCMAPTALNYNPSATVDDGSCEYIPPWPPVS